MRRTRIAIFGEFNFTVLGQSRAKLTDQVAEIGRARNQNANVNYAALGKCAESVQITIKRLILAVPLQVKRHAMLNIIDFMAIEIFLTNYLALNRIVFRFSFGRMAD